jgi:hypothetical protein
MGNILKVHHNDLENITTKLAETSQTFSDIANHIKGAAIVGANWPEAAGDAQAAYGEACTASEDGATAVKGAGFTLAENTDKVIAHYRGAEFASSLIRTPHSGKAQTPKSVSIPSGLMNVATSVPSGLAVGGLAATAYNFFQAQGVVARLAATVRYTTAVAIVGAMGIVMTLNIRDACPFREAGEKWTAIKTAVDKNDLDAFVNAAGWEGPAATRFHEHMTSTFLPVLGEFSVLAGSMVRLCYDMANALDASNHAYAQLGEHAIVVLGSLSLIALRWPPAQITLNIAAGSYLAAALTQRDNLRDSFGAKARDIKAVEAQAAALEARCLDDKKHNRLEPTFTMVDPKWRPQDWFDNWHYQPDGS